MALGALAPFAGALFTDPGVKAAFDALHLPAIAGLLFASAGAITIAARILPHLGED